MSHCGCFFVTLALLITSAKQEELPPSKSPGSASGPPDIPSKAFDDTVLYKIQFNEEDDPSIPESVAERAKNKNLDIYALNEEEESENFVWLKTKNDETYYCVLPSFGTEGSDQKPSSQDQTLEDLSPYELLKPLIDREVCSYRMEQYWTYELCHGRYLRQFHEESAIAKTPNQEFFLGKFDASKQLTITEKEFSDRLSQLKEQGKNPPTVTVEGKTLPFIEFNFTSGTTCDLNNKPRVTRVLYICGDGVKNELTSVKETFSCEYEAIVLSPMLCLHKDYQLAPVIENVIRCFPVAGSPSKPKDMKEFEAGIRSKSRAETLFDGKTIIFESAEIGPNGVHLQVQVHDPDAALERLTERARWATGLGKASDHPRVTHNSLSSKDALLATEFMEGSYCISGGTGWWRHEFCYGRKITQYHDEEGTRKQTITLGRWNPEKHIEWLNQHPEKRPKKGKTPKMVSHFYADGDICEETGKPRQVEVKLKCKYQGGQLDTIALYLLEPYTCDYILGVESPIFCHLLNSIDSNGLIEYSPNILPIPEPVEKKEDEDKGGEDKMVNVEEKLLEALLRIEEIKRKHEKEMEESLHDGDEDEEESREKKHRIVKKDLGNPRDEL